MVYYIIVPRDKKNERKETNMKTSYICDSENFDTIFGNQYPVCITKTEIMRLSAEWECDLMEQFHEASESEIAEYGVYDDGDK